MRRAVLFVVCAACGGGETPALPCSAAGPEGEVTIATGIERTVVFHDAQGGVLSQTVVDRDGVARGTIPPCGAVTVGHRGELLTITQLQPGDSVVVIPPGFVAAGPRDLEVSFPLVAGASTYLLGAGNPGGAPCGPFTTTTSPVVITVPGRCRANDLTTAVTAYAFDASNVLLAYASIDNVDLTAPVAVTAWRTERRTATVTFGAPPEPDWKTSLTVTPHRGELQLLTRGPWITTALSDTEIVLPAVGDAVLMSAMFARSLTLSRDIDTLVLGNAALPAAISVDATQFAPHVTSVSLTQTDPQRPVIAWTTSRPTDDELAIAVVAEYVDTTWSVLVPANQPGIVRFPLLPAELEPTPEFVPPPSDATVAVIGTNVFADYAAARREPLALFLPMNRVPIVELVYRVSTKGLFQVPIP